MAMPISILLRLSLVYFLFAKYSQASRFKPNCTLPPTGTTYVSGSNTRGTIAILWNCLSVIILCTWSILRLNVPASRPRAKGIMQKAWWAILDSRVKIKWMIFTVLVPEYLVGKALGERLAAKAGMKHAIPGPGVEWEEIHAYMANMGHFVLDFGRLLGVDGDDGNGTGEVEVSQADPPFKTNVKEVLDEATRPGNSSLFSAAPLLASLSGSARINISRFEHRYWALNSYQFQSATEREIADLPNVTVRDLEKLDRGETLVKALALIQVTYLIVQLVARKVADLPSTQLEIAALAFSVSSIITYILYWNRPQGVESVCFVKAKKIPSKWALEEMARFGPSYLWFNCRAESKFTKELDLAPIPNDGSHRIRGALSLPNWINDAIGANDEVLILAIGALFGGMLFGGLHCLAWNFHFPTSGEVLAWRICSVVTSCLPPLSIVPLSRWIALHPWGGGVKGSLPMRFAINLTLIAFLVSYVLARLFLLVEIFRSLFFLPPEAFIDTWSGSFPHWG